MILRPRINKIRRWGGGKGIITGYALQESPVLILDAWEWSYQIRLGKYIIVKARQEAGGRRQEAGEE